MKFPDLTGLTRTIQREVTPEMTAAHVGSGGVEVLSTPTMILLFEQAARDAVQDSLPEGYTTVGTRVDIEHVSATPAGMTVTVTSTVDSVEGRTVNYTVEARDAFGRVGGGSHRRAIIRLDTFMERLAERG